VETRSASVSVARFRDPQPSRTIGMIWRKTNPLAGQLLQLSEVVCGSADALRRPSRGHHRPILQAKTPPRQA
jgi:LysR family hydrogen peroxide-inducible transcriptional activator